MKRITCAGAAVVALAASLAMTGCLKSSTAPPGGDAANSVTVLISGDTNIQDLWQKALIPGFEKANPGKKINITFDLHGANDQQNLGKLSAAVKSGNDPSFDLIEGGFVNQAAQAKLLEPESDSNLSALSKVPKTLVTQGLGAGVPYRASSVLLAYNTKNVSSPPKTLAELLAWIKAHPGKFAYNSPKSGGSGGAFVATVLDANMDAATQQKMRVSYDESLESAWDPGFKQLKSLNPYVYGKGVYPNGNDAVLNLMSTGEIDVAPVWSDQFLSGQKNGQIPATVKVTQISNPSFTGGGAYLGLAKTSTHKELAQKVLEYVLTAESQTSIASDIAGYPVIPLADLPADVQKRFADAKPDQLRTGFFANFSNDVNSKWDQKVPGK